MIYLVWICLSHCSHGNILMHFWYCVDHLWRIIPTRWAKVWRQSSKKCVRRETRCDTSDFITPVFSKHIRISQGSSYGLSCVSVLFCLCLKKTKKQAEHAWLFKHESSCQPPSAHENMKLWFEWHFLIKLYLILNQCQPQLFFSGSSFLLLLII